MGLKRVRVIAWIGWPIAVPVAGISVLHFLRYRLGWGIYWVWSLTHVLPVILVMLVPPVILEVLLRRARSNG